MELGKVKRVIKDPMFIGAVIGLVLAAVWTVLVAAGHLRQRIVWAAHLATYPVPSLLILFNVLELQYASRVAMGYLSLYVWYIQFGFFSGFFIKRARKRFSKKISAAMLILAIALVCALIFWLNIVLYLGGACF